MNDYEVQVTFFVQAAGPAEALWDIDEACRSIPGGYGYEILDDAVTLVDEP